MDFTSRFAHVNISVNLNTFIYDMFSLAALEVHQETAGPSSCLI